MKKFVSDYIDKINKNNNTFLIHVIIPTLSHNTAFAYIDLNFYRQRKENRVKQIFIRQPSCKFPKQKTHFSHEYKL